MAKKKITKRKPPRGAKKSPAGKKSAPAPRSSVARRKSPPKKAAMAATKPAFKDEPPVPNSVKTGSQTILFKTRDFVTPLKNCSLVGRGTFKISSCHLVPLSIHGQHVAVTFTWEETKKKSTRRGSNGAGTQSVKAGDLTITVDSGNITITRTYKKIAYPPIDER